MTSLFSPSSIPQKLKIRPHRRPTKGRTAIHEIVPITARATVSMMRPGRSRRRTKARWGVMKPPRQPRWRMASSAGERIWSARTLEIDEYTGCPSKAMVGRFLVLFDVEVHTPVGTDPLSPGAANVMNGKVEKNVVSRSQRSGRADDLIAFAAPSVAKGKIVLFIMALIQRNKLSAGENIPWS